MTQPPLTLRERAEGRIARALPALPRWLQRVLSGRGPIRIDGQELEGELQLILAMRSRMGALPFHAQQPGDLRRGMRREMFVHRGPETPVRAVKDLLIDGGAGPIAARHYAPASAAGRPLLVYFHGGGMVCGDLDTHDAFCRLVCQTAALNVLAVDYRLAPEAPFPAGLDDARAAFGWAVSHAAELGADPERIAVGGDSAGGTLAAVVAQLQARAGAQRPLAQLLIYPATDRTTDRPSLSLFAQGFLLTRRDIDWFTEQYAGSVGADAADPLISPLRAPDLSGLPTALVVTGGFDPLRDEGEAYAEALRAAGSRVVLLRMNGLVHGFINLTDLSPVSRGAVLEICGALRGLLSASPSIGPASRGAQAA